MNSITAADVGKRVSIQFFDDDGLRREAVGVFESLTKESDDVILHIRRRDESVTDVRLKRIRFGKVIG